MQPRGVRAQPWSSRSIAKVPSSPSRQRQTTCGSEHRSTAHCPAASVQANRLFTLLHLFLFIHGELHVERPLLQAAIAHDAMGVVVDKGRARLLRTAGRRASAAAKPAALEMAAPPCKQPSLMMQLE